MKKILLTAAESSLRSSSYVSPEAKVSEMHSEGVLCMSLLQQNTFSVEKWEEDEGFSW